MSLSPKKLPRKSPLQNGALMRDWALRNTDIVIPSPYEIIPKHPYKKFKKIKLLKDRMATYKRYIVKKSVQRSTPLE